MHKRVLCRRAVAEWVGVCHVRVLCGNGYRYSHSPMKCEYETVPKLLNGAISNDIE